MLSLLETHRMTEDSDEEASENQIPHLKTPLRRLKDPTFMLTVHFLKHWVTWSR